MGGKHGASHRVYRCGQYGRSSPRRIGKEGLQNTVLVFDVSEQALANAVSLGAEGASSAAEVAMKADIIVLAVKPQFYPDVLPQVQEICAKRRW
ncbi:MAG: NAD(P)-binding domain-containing protein [Hydrogeniiclostridium mannosilyticum]